MEILYKEKREEGRGILEMYEKKLYFKNEIIMYTDIHCHPYDLFRVFPQAEEERRRIGVIAAASACDLEELTYNEKLAQEAAQGASAQGVVAEKIVPLLPCFAIHPQQFAVWQEEKSTEKTDVLLAELEKLALEGRIAAVGECGFDLYNEKFKATEIQQDEVFAAHIETALRHDLPVILHVRRAMHKIFALSKKLARCKAVVFHSWPGTFEEGQVLLRRGVNVYFSFGCCILNGHKKAINSCALLPADRLLTETDAPYQPAHGESFSQWRDLPRIVKTIAKLRGEALGQDINEKTTENIIENNFQQVFCKHLYYPSFLYWTASPPYVKIKYGI